MINQSGIFSLIPAGKSRRILFKIAVHHPSTCSKSGKISSIPSTASMGESGVKLCSTPANSSGFKAAANCCVELRRLSTATFGGNTVPVPVLSWETIEFNCSIASCSRITVSAWLKFSRSFGWVIIFLNPLPFFFKISFYAPFSRFFNHYFPYPPDCLW